MYAVDNFSERCRGAYALDALGPGNHQRTWEYQLLLRLVLNVGFLNEQGTQKGVWLVDWTSLTGSPSLLSLLIIMATDLMIEGCACSKHL